MTTITLAVIETLGDLRVTTKTVRLNGVARTPTKIWIERALHQLVLDTTMETGAHEPEHAAVLLIEPLAKLKLEAIIIRNHSVTTTMAEAIYLIGQG